MLLQNNTAFPMDKYLLSILVENNSGVLARVTSLFGRRGYNIDSLTVSTTEDEKISRITIVVHGDEAVMQQVSKQVLKLEEVIKVYHLLEAKSFCRELLLMKVKTDRHDRAEILDIVGIYEGKVVDMTAESLIIELVGNPAKLNTFLTLVSADYDVIEMSRTGVTALERGI